MFSKRVAIICMAASVGVTPATQSAADLADGLVGGLVGGVVGGVIVNEGAKNRERQRQQRQNSVSRTTPTYNSAARVATREEQVALNYFGFPAGTPDGVRGRNTRNAISQYQAHMSFPITGALSPYERDFLVGSYYRAQSGGVATTQLIAQRGQGTRGLLYAYRDEAAGGSLSGTVASTDNTGTISTAPETNLASTQDSGSSLPNLFGNNTVSGPSLASHCSRVSLVTNSNGGFVTQASMTDAKFVLSEQFCLARTYAIADGEELASRVEGLNQASLEQQCGAFGPAMKKQLTALSLQPQQAVMADVGRFILDSGMEPAQLAGTARICLSVGYRTDNMDVAAGSALLLTALGERGYAELLGHHLNEGFGAAKRPDLAVSWYETGIQAVDANGPVFVPGDPGRNDLIRTAVYGTGGTDQKTQNLTGDGEQSIQPASSLPSFTIAE